MCVFTLVAVGSKGLSAENNQRSLLKAARGKSENESVLSHSLEGVVLNRSP